MELFSFQKIAISISANHHPLNTYFQRIKTPYLITVRSKAGFTHPLILTPRVKAAVMSAAAAAKFKDLTDVLNRSACYCLNENPNATFANLFMGDGTLLLKSDADGNGAPAPPPACSHGTALTTLSFSLCCL